MGKAKPNLAPALGATAVVVLIALWLITGLLIGDLGWFLPVFSADASSLDLYWDGRRVHLEPGDDGYALLNEALKEDFAHVRAYPDTTGLSDASLEELRASGRLLEITYAEPVRIHNQYMFGPSRVFYVPLSGHHAGLDRVFNVGRGAPLQLRDMDAILPAIEALVQQEGLESP